MEETRNGNEEIGEQLSLFPETDESPFMGTSGRWFDLRYEWSSLDDMVLRSFAGYMQSCNCFTCQTLRVVHRLGRVT